MIGIIILNFNTPNDVIKCVSSIEAGTKNQYKIYIVDNMSTDNSVEILNDRFVGVDKIKIIVSNYNGGYSYGNNLGIEKAIEDGCDYILVSNPDVIYYDGAIDVLFDAISVNDEIGIVGPSTPSLDQLESQLLRKVYTPRLYFFSKKPFRFLSKICKSLRTEFPYPKDQEKAYLFDGMVRGCCFMISAQLFREMGLFDDNVFLYSEEWIIAKKLCEKGLKCAFISKAKALHKEATSTKKVGTGFQSFHLYLSAFYYLKYYTEASKSFLRFVYVQNVINFYIKSLFNSSYRKYLKKFKIAQKNLAHGKKKILVESVE